jgi:ankyrin repeat protein
MNMQHGYTAFHFAVSDAQFSGVFGLILSKNPIPSWFVAPVHPIHIAVANFNNQILDQLLNYCVQGPVIRSEKIYSDKSPNKRVNATTLLSSVIEIQIRSSELDWTWGLSNSPSITSIDTDKISSGTALHVAAYVNNDKAAELLLNSGAFVDSLDDDDRTPLHIAALSDSYDVTKILVDHGANLNARDKSLMTPSMLAAEAGFERIFELLQDSGSDISIRSNDGRLVLHYAVYCSNMTIMLRMIWADEDTLRQEDYYGNTLIHDIFDEGKANHISYLLNSGVDLTVCTDRIGSIFQFPLEFKTLRRILRRFSPNTITKLVNFRVKHQGTPLYLSATGGHERNTELLIDAGALIELEGGEFGTPLMGACEAGRLQQVKVLVSRRAKLVYLNERSQMVSAIALAKHHPLLIRWLLVERHIEQLRICQDSDISTKSSRIIPWMGLYSMEVALPRAYKQSMFGHLLKMTELRKRYSGKVHTFIA